METMTITKDQLRAALQRWEQDARDGKTLSEAESRSRPVEQVAAASADRLWADMSPAHSDYAPTA